MMETYKIRQYLQEITALKNIYNELSSKESLGKTGAIRNEIAKQQLLKAIHETRKAVAAMERDLQIE